VPSSTDIRSKRRFFDEPTPNEARLVKAARCRAEDWAMSKEQLVDQLRTLLRDVLRLRFEGAAYAKLCRVHGYADGYMKALLDAGLVDKEALLEAVSDERRRYIEETPAMPTSSAAA
jgi:hypothetical protein